MGAASREETLAAADVEDPAVQRAGEPQAGELALAEPSAAVWAHVTAGVHGIAHADEHDPDAIDLHRSEGSRGQIREGGDPDFPRAGHA